MLQLLFAVSIAQEPVIANAVESTGENVEEESPDELLDRESHHFLLIAVAVVPPVELNLPVFDIHDPMIGNRDRVRVAADVVHHLLRSGERGLGVDHPFQFAQRIEMPAETCGSRKASREAENLSLAVSKASCRYVKNNRWNRQDSTRIGKKKRERQGIHRVPSSEIPPPGTTQSRWG